MVATDMRGFFGVGVEGTNKPMNLGNLFRSAHAFGASFIFTVGDGYQIDRGGRADTAATPRQVPLYGYPDAAGVALPEGCALIGIELLDSAIDLPSFRHPRRAAYVFGPERGNLSPELIARCDFTVKIPTKFCINVGTAGAIVMYDRTISLGRFGRRPELPGGAISPPPAHVFGAPRRRQAKKDR